MLNRKLIIALLFAVYILLCYCCFWIFSPFGLIVADSSYILAIVITLYLRKLYYRIIINRVNQKLKSLILNEKYEEAIHYINSIIKNEPKFNDLWAYKCIILAYQGKFTEFNNVYRWLMYSKMLFHKNMFYDLNCVKAMIDFLYHNIDNYDIQALHCYPEKPKYEVFQKCGICILKFCEKDYEASLSIADEIIKESNIWIYAFFGYYIKSYCKLYLGDIKSAEENKKELFQFSQYESTEVIINIMDKDSSNISGIQNDLTQEENRNFNLLYKNTNRKKHFVIAVSVIGGFIVLLSGALFMNRNIIRHPYQEPFDLKIYNKSYEANYGRLAMADEGKIYFEYLSGIYVLDTSNDSIAKFKKGITRGTLFSVDNNQLYYMENDWEFRITSSNLGGKSFHNKEDDLGYNREADNCQYFFESNKLYVVNKRQNCISVCEYHDIETASHALSGNDLQSIDSYTDLFSIYKDDTHFYIQDKQKSNSSMNINLISGIYTVKNSCYTPFDNNNLSILAYDKQKDAVYILYDNAIYYLHDNKISKLTNTSLIKNASALSEDGANLYIVSKNSTDEFISVDKANGTTETIYGAAANEHILYVSPHFFITYSNGEISKTIMGSNEKKQTLRLFDANQDSIELECSGNYLFAKRANELHCVDLDAMKELSLNQ